MAGASQPRTVLSAHLSCHTTARVNLLACEPSCVTFCLKTLFYSEKANVCAMALKGLHHPGCLYLPSSASLVSWLQPHWLLWASHGRHAPCLGPGAGIPASWSIFPRRDTPSVSEPRPCGHLGHCFHHRHSSLPLLRMLLFSTLPTPPPTAHTAF